jgi:predicted outer membrane repeat protein
MPLISWLRNRMTGRPPMRRPAAGTPTARFRPQLEVLEGRDVPSTLTVTSAADSGTGSLRAEIAAAQPGDTIVFSPSLDDQTIKLTSGELAINKSLTIQGPGAGQLAISGGNAMRVFDVSGANTNVTLSGLTITGGNGRWTDDSGDGGGILNTNGSTLTLSGCTVSGNSASWQGGGVANLNATLNLVNSTLSGNSVTWTNGEGGALYSGGPDGKVSMTGCTVSNNTAEFLGGGIYTTGTTMTINGCTLAGNLVLNRGWPTAANEIYNVTPGGTLTVSDSVFSKDYMYTNIYHPIEGSWINGGGNTGV